MFFYFYWYFFIVFSFIRGHQFIKYLHSSNTHLSIFSLSISYCLGKLFKILYTFYLSWSWPLISKVLMNCYNIRDFKRNLPAFIYVNESWVFILGEWSIINSSYIFAHAQIFVIASKAKTFLPIFMMNFVTDIARFPSINSFLLFSIES